MKKKREMQIRNKYKKRSYFQKLFQHEISMNEQNSQEKFEKIYFGYKNENHFFWIMPFVYTD